MFLQVSVHNGGAPAGIEARSARIEPVHRIFFSTVTAKARKRLGMGVNPVKHVERFFQGRGIDSALKDVVLKVMIGGIGCLLALKDLCCVGQGGHTVDKTLLFDLATRRVFEEGEKGDVRFSKQVLALHLALGWLPGGGPAVGSRALDDKELTGLKGFLGWMKKGGCSEIDPPALGRMLDVGIGLFGVVGQLGRPADKAWLKHIQQSHRYS